MSNSKGRVKGTDIHVSKRIRERRLLLGINQHELASAVCVSIQQIQKYEKGTNRVSSGKLYDFSKLLKVPIQFFFDGIEHCQNEENYLQMAEEGVTFESGISKKSREREIVSLVKYFCLIKNINERKTVIDLAKALTKRCST